MKRIKWWLRIVGGFYLFLTMMNLYAMFFNLEMFRGNLPFPADAIAVRAFSDAWLVFVLELGVLGGMMLYASRTPASSRILVLTVIAAEAIRGVVADAIWISRGYPAASYVPFIGVHLAIIITGIVFLRPESASQGA